MRKRSSEKRPNLYLRIECSVAKGEDQGLWSLRTTKATQSENQLYHFLILEMLFAYSQHHSIIWKIRILIIIMPVFSGSF